MKIQSRFKDYYDYVAHLYGGGDPKVIYEREPLTAMDVNGYRPSVVLEHRVDYHIPDSLRAGTRFAPYIFAVLVIMDRPFLLYRRVFETDDRYQLYDFEGANPLALGEKRFTWSSNTTDYPRGKPGTNILELTKKVGAPVYMIEMGSRYTHNVRIKSEIPVLGKLGVAAFYPAEQIYQDLAYFIGNTMKDSPDIKPPVEVDDLTRLQQYGFDKKTSFRHRKS